MMNLKDFKSNDWVQIWEGGWSFLSCSHFGDGYTKKIKFGKKTFVSKVVIFSHRGRSTAWIRQADRDRLGKYLALQVKKEPARAKQICKDLKREVDETLHFMKVYGRGTISLKVYKEFWHRIYIYYGPHINIKYIVDYLDEKSLRKLLPMFEEARVYAEPVFKHSEEFVNAFAKQYAKQIKYPLKTVLALTKGEIYGSVSRLPRVSELNLRYKDSAILFDEKTSTVVMGPDLKKVRDLVVGSSSATELKGVSAFPGKLKGIAKIVNDPKQGRLLKKGEILISGMTRPELLPVMKRAAAFVTDSGGILCHAAIVAREMKKPCIIGTRVATKVFKNGDRIEVDATKGIVKKV